METKQLRELAGSPSSLVEVQVQLLHPALERIPEDTDDLDLRKLREKLAWPPTMTLTMSPRLIAHLLAAIGERLVRLAEIDNEEETAPAVSVDEPVVAPETNVVEEPAVEPEVLPAPDPEVPVVEEPAVEPEVLPAPDPEVPVVDEPAVKPEVLPAPDPEVPVVDEPAVEPEPAVETPKPKPKRKRKL